MTQKICMICHNAFEPKTKSRKYCTPQCYWESLKDKVPVGGNRHPKQTVIVKCVECGEEFGLPPSKANRSKNLFCSKECSAAHSRSKISHHVDKSLLEQLYAKEKLSFSQIAERIGSTVWVVRRLLTENGILLRNKSEWAKSSWLHSSDERKLMAVQTGKRNAAKNLAFDSDRRAEIAAMGAAALRDLRGPTSIETRMMQALEASGFEYNFQEKIGNKFLCDFILVKYNIVIECDGIYWHSRPDAIRRDKSKDAYLAKCGYIVLRFTDKEIKTDIKKCIEAIAAHVSSK